jgi:hypothetical protein
MPPKAYDQDDATDFIRINALRLKVASKVQRENKVLDVKLKTDSNNGHS